MTALSVFKTLGCLAKDRIKALAANVTRHRPYLRIFTPLCALHALITQHQNPGNISGQAVETTGCLGGKDYFFIGSDDGHTYPCGYRGREDLGPFPDMNLRGKGREPACRQCDWECFRDPSELFSPPAGYAPPPENLQGADLGPGRQCGSAPRSRCFSILRPCLRQGLSGPPKSTCWPVTSPKPTCYSMIWRSRTRTGVGI